MSGMAPPMGFAGGRQGMSFPYQMSGPSGAIMTNMHQPGTPMVAVGNVGGMMPGGYNPGPSPHGPHHLHMYGHANQPQAHQDRPFKCDECTQSFNRNHDLKRHKKIHLAVKPFPCTFCEKAFSRKDALKVCKLHSQSWCRRGAAVTMQCIANFKEPLLIFRTETPTCQGLRRETTGRGIERITAR
jgi:hypothetical protein